MWYQEKDHQEYCGDYDTEYFSAKTMCCACDGGSIAMSPKCKDNAFDALDAQNEGCTWYDANWD